MTKAEYEAIKQEIKTLAEWLRELRVYRLMMSRLGEMLADNGYTEADIDRICKEMEARKMTIEIDEAINKLNKLRSIHNGSYAKEIDMAIKALEQTRWIPCSERLPEEVMPCIVTIRMGTDYFVNKRYYDPTLGWDDNTNGWEKVVAWIPQPEPYQAESEDKE